MKLSLKWDLSDLYNTIKDPKIKKDLDSYKKKALDFAKKYKGKIKSLKPKDFVSAIREYEDMVSISNRLGSFAYLNVSTQFNDKDALAFYQNIEEKLTQSAQPLIFFSLEINKLDDKKFEALLKGNPYQSWLKEVRQFKKYELSEELEEMLLLKSTTSRSNWVRLYDETCSNLKYTVDGKAYSDAEISKLLMNKDPKIREKAGLEINNISKQNASLFALIYNTIIKDKAINDEKRGFKTPIASQNLGNNVDDKAVIALSEAVRDNYKNIAHSYYKWKAKVLGVKKLQYWDRNAPLPFASDSELKYEYAVPQVLEAYERFSCKLKEVALPFFENAWIDVNPKDGKRSGAYAMSVSPTVHPYLFLNWTNKRRDVLTLAHELGHGCHMRLSAVQGELQDGTPLTLSEVASVFGEMVTFQSMLENTKDKQEKICLLAGKVEDMINTAIRQIAFHFFELRAHEERKQGEVSEERLCQIWLEEMRASLGDSVNVDENSAYIWVQVSHFYHLPFYVYAYSFADCLVNSLYQAYQSGKVKDFEDKYLHMLSLAGTKKYDEMLKPFGLKANSKDFWNMGLGLIAKYIDELEKLGK